jgi:hypothetical protein
MTEQTIVEDEVVEEVLDLTAYFYETETRLLFPNAIKWRYEEAGMWPTEGFEVPGSVADEYIQSEFRSETEIVKVGDKFEIREIE